jgi:YgiT-type zinc finger domain-containing protein
MTRGAGKKGERMVSTAMCGLCGDSCEDKLITIALPRSEGVLALIKNVPAEVCLRCGETRFTLGTTGRLMAAVRGGRPPDDVAVIPIYDLEVKEVAAISAR